MAKTRPTALEHRLEQTVAELEAAITSAKQRHEETHTHYRKLLAEKNEQHGKEMEIEYQRRQTTEAHNLVLQSDRDRLTATVETLARRLASPTAETDASRAGWRSANRLNPSDVENFLRKR